VSDSKMNPHSRLMDWPNIPTAGTVTLANFIPSVNNRARNLQGNDIFRFSDAAGYICTH
jgi:hypothetical protein